LCEAREHPVGEVKKQDKNNRAFCEIKQEAFREESCQTLSAGAKSGAKSLFWLRIP
jgi:hypothetical protein